MSDCQCDYSYTCRSCQARIDAANAVEYSNEIREWMVQVVVALGKALNIELPDPPKKRDY